VYVEGTPDVRTYTTQDGRNGASLTLRTVSIQLLGGRPNEGGGAPQQEGGASYGAPSYQQPASSGGSADLSNPVDDLPF